MSNVVDELLLLASVRKMGEVEMGPLDMTSIVAEAQARLADLIEERQAEVILTSALTSSVALGYGPWMEEVWVNYLSNAIKFRFRKREFTNSIIITCTRSWGVPGPRLPRSRCRKALTSERN
jgi:signal transduction histidine kinase